MKVLDGSSAGLSIGFLMPIIEGFMGAIDGFIGGLGNGISCLPAPACGPGIFAGGCMYKVEEIK